MKKLNLLLILAVLFAGFTINTQAQKSEKIKKIMNGTISENLQIGKNSVFFTLEGSKMVGNLFIPENYQTGQKLPAIVVITPASGVKEQVAGVYAEKLSKKGFITLAFDHRTYGESEGEPRQIEDIFKKTEDIKTAISFLRSLEQVDRDKIGAVGICAGAAYVVQTSVGERRIKAVATISGSLDLQGTIALIGGDKILAMANKGRQKYDETGEMTYMEMFPKPTAETNPFMRESYEYYVGNQDKFPTWKNQIDAINITNTAAFDILNIASFVAPTPILFIAGDKALTGPFSKKAYDNAKEPKDLFWVEGATHISLYYNEDYINKVTVKLSDFFGEKLK